MQESGVSSYCIAPGIEVPLSYPQRWMWVMSKLMGPACALRLALRLSGELQVGAVEAALHDVIEYHQALRMVYGERRGIPYQVILDVQDARPPVAVTATTESELGEDLSGAMSQTIDLTREIPFHSQIFEIDRTEHVLLMNIHHIAADQWSLRLLTRDFSLAYSARHRGDKHNFPPLPLQYADYALWQTKVFGEDADPQSEQARHLSFWKRTLENMPRQISLPAKRTRRGPGTCQAGSVPVRLDGTTLTRLNALGRENHASAFIMVHAAVAATLTAFGAGDDVPICAPIAGRGNILLENVVGLFLNTLILRTDTSGNPTFRELLSRVRATDLDAYDHQDTPFELVLRSAARDRALAGRPAIQVCLIVNDGPGRKFDLAATRVRCEAVPNRYVMFDLLFDLRVRRTEDGIPDGLDGAIIYSADIFDGPEVERISEQLQHGLSSAAAGPDRSIGQLFRST